MRLLLAVALAVLPAQAAWSQSASPAPADAAVAASGDASDNTVADDSAAEASQEIESGAETNTAGADADTAPPAPSVWPLIAMGVGVFVVLALMIGFKTHAFVALIIGALVISFFVPTDVTGFAKTPYPHVIKGDPNPANIVGRVTSSLGGAVGGVGVLIAMAAIIGKCMLVSGAADRIVKSTLDVFGEKRAALAMMVSGFVLSVPVFFDTVFYLLVPLARSLYRRTKKNYLLYLSAIAAGGAITHTLVPPTPGPLLVADALKADIGTVMMLGILIGAPASVVGLIVSGWLNKVMPVEMRPMAGGKREDEEFERLPSLWLALVPVLLPVVLITIETILQRILNENSPQFLLAFHSMMKLVGNANFAMILAALCAIYLCWSVQGHSFKQLAEHIDDALLSGGVIILITAAGGAFGGLLAMTEIQTVVESWFASSKSGGLVVIFVAYGLAALLKIAQGSSTVAMIISSSLVSTIALPLATAGTLGFSPAYLVPVIGAGSLMGSWMNDSGFWVFAKMGVLTEGETLRSWTIVLSILSLSAFAITLLLVTIMPLA